MQGRAAPLDPNRVTLYAGRCVGGPFDGKPLYHGEPVHKVAMRSGRAAIWMGAPTDEISVNEYRFENGWWVWTLA